MCFVHIEHFRHSFSGIPLDCLGPLSSVTDGGRGGEQVPPDGVFSLFFALLVIFSNISVTTCVCFMLIHPSHAIPSFFHRLGDT